MNYLHYAPREEDVRGRDRFRVDDRDMSVDGDRADLCR
jgi:hypothetical protein